MLHCTTNQSTSGRVVNFAPLSNVLMETGCPLSKTSKSPCFRVLSGRPFLVFRAITSTKTRWDEPWKVISGERVAGEPSWATAGSVKTLTESDNSANRSTDFTRISTLHRLQKDVLQRIAAEIESADPHITLRRDAIDV